MMYPRPEDVVDVNRPSSSSSLRPSSSKATSSTSLRLRMNNLWMKNVVLVVCVVVLGSLTSFSTASITTTTSTTSNFDQDYDNLFQDVADKDGLESIRLLHQHLDGDNDGTIEPDETGEFIRGDLSSSDPTKRQSLFHMKDAEITVIDLWTTWRKSEVHNWTTEQTVDWLVHNVELPQYSDHFMQNGVNGSKVPSLAVNSPWLNKVIGIRNPIHRSKIALKAMDIVLFGPPKDQNNFVKDVIFTVVILLAITGLFYAYRENCKAQDHLRKMMEDIDKLGVAEQDLVNLQKKLEAKENKIKKMQSVPYRSNSTTNNPMGLNNVINAVDESVELKRCKEEIEVLRNQLYAAETELEDKCWCCPPVLQTWLQITYEIEALSYAAKRKQAEEQFENAKDMCEKLKKKRSSLVGAFVSTHGHSIDDIDRMILDAKSSLVEATNDLKERSQRWKQIEMMCACNIVNNPGLQALYKQVRTVGHGRNPHGLAGLGGGGGRLNSRMSSTMDIDADDNSDSYSIAPSMTSGITTSSRASMLKSRANLPPVIMQQHPTTPSTTGRVRPSLSRDSSKDSTVSSSSAGSSDELEMQNLARLSSLSSSGAINYANHHHHSNYNKADNSPKMEKVINSPTLGQLGKSTTIYENEEITGSNSIDSGISLNLQQQQQQQQQQLVNKQNLKSSIAAAVVESGLPASMPLPIHDVDNMSAYSAASDSGSITDLEKKEKKKRSFLIFKRKNKEKKQIL